VTLPDGVQLYLATDNEAAADAALRTRYAAVPHARVAGKTGVITAVLAGYGTAVQGVQRALTGAVLADLAAGSPLAGRAVRPGAPGTAWVAVANQPGSPAGVYAVPAAVAAAASERYQAALAAERAGGKLVSDPRDQPGMAIPPGGMRLSLHSGSSGSGGTVGTSGGGVTSGGGSGSAFAGGYTAGGGGSGSAFAGGGHVTGSGGSGGGGGAWTSGTVYGAGGSGSWQSPADFDHGGELDLPAPPDSEAFAAGSVTGYRWWRMTAPDFTRSPLDADRDWPQKGLCGQYDYWQPGVNHADCKSNARNHEPGTIPVLSCRCGYWAYWKPQQHDLSGSGEIAVFGVIKGWGKVLLGRKGFRAGTARLIAVYVASSLVPRYPDGASPVTVPRGGVDMLAIPGSLGGALARNARFTGKVYSYGTDTDRYERAAPYSPTPRQLLAAETHAEAWLAVIGDRIGQMYPGTDICETRDRMLAKYPSTPQYAPAAPSPDAPCRHGQPRRDCLTCFILG
jgi:hypothetical protein